MASRQFAVNRSQHSPLAVPGRLAVSSVLLLMFTGSQVRACSTPVFQYALENWPAADGVDEAAVFHPAPVSDVGGGRLRRTEPAFTQEPAAKRAVSQQTNAELVAISAHRSAGTDRGI